MFLKWGKFWPLMARVLCHYYVLDLSLLGRICLNPHSLPYFSQMLLSCNDELLSLLHKRKLSKKYTHELFSINNFMYTVIRDAMQQFSNHSKLDFINGCRIKYTLLYVTKFYLPGLLPLFNNIYS